MSDRGQIVLTLSVLACATLLAALKIISADMWQGILIGGVFPSVVPGLFRKGPGGPAASGPVLPTGTLASLFLGLALRALVLAWDARAIP